MDFELEPFAHVKIPPSQWNYSHHNERIINRLLIKSHSRFAPRWSGAVIFVKCGVSTLISTLFMNHNKVPIRISCPFLAYAAGVSKRVLITAPETDNLKHWRESFALPPIHDDIFKRLKPLVFLFIENFSPFCLDDECRLSWIWHVAVWL